MDFQQKLDHRTRLLNDFRKAGSATIGDILRADFGHWPPHGINLAKTPEIFERQVRIQNFPILNENIHTNLIEIYQRGQIGTLSVENLTFLFLGATPILFNAVAGYGLAKVAKMVFSENFPNTAGYVTIKDPDKINLSPFLHLLGKHQIADTISHENIHCIDELLSPDRTINCIKDKGYKFLHRIIPHRAKRVRYLTQDNEIMARLHCILSTCYLLNGTMPQNFDEMTSYLKLCGVRINGQKPSRKFTKIAKEKLGDDYDRLRRATKENVGDLNYTYRALKKDIHFIQSAQILISYINLLNVYGSEVTVQDFMMRDPIYQEKVQKLLNRPSKSPKCYSITLR